MSHIFQGGGGGGLRTTLGGGGVELRVCEGLFFSLFHKWFFYWILWVSPDKLQIQLVGMPCNAVHCCGVLWSR